MIKTRTVRNVTSKKDLLETYSDENYRLRQTETEKVYGSHVIDSIAGYRDGVPYGAFTYTETDEMDEYGDDAAPEDYEKALKILLGTE